MSVPLIVDGNSYQYPSQGDKANTGWGNQTTNWASAVTSALTKLGLGGTLSPLANAVIDISSTSKGILIPRMTTAQRNAISSPANSLIVFNTDLKVLQYYDSSVTSWISVGAKLPDNVVFSGTLTVNGNITGLGSISATSGINGATGNFTDTTDATDADNAPLKTLGGMAVKKKLFVGTDLSVGGNLNFTDSTDATSSTNAPVKTAGGMGIAKKLFVGTDATVGGVTYLDDDTTANTPVISFTGDTNTGFGRSGADTLDFITNGNSRFRIESTGQLQAVISGNTTFYPGYLCRAWVNFNGTLSGTISPRGSGNISSVVKNSTGDYTINIDIDMLDANYGLFINSLTSGQLYQGIIGLTSYSASSFRFRTVRYNGTTLVDEADCFAGVFR